MCNCVVPPPFPLTQSQLPTLPLAPSHQSSHAAVGIELEVLAALPREPAARRLLVHVAPCDYVGSLRRLLGQQLQREPQHLRLLHAGWCACVCRRVRA